ncbi:uncharacterized protein YdgA (DUF945 family) [Neisseria sp. HSC-16F19]|nr:YdgA family protein [Neisseria sp. HSC-16F19]MCP2040379.1 uncharacterized protein YdgA (DUF945 family) [Neisseria sp. HSC-16F19]
MKTASKTLMGVIAAVVVAAVLLLLGLPYYLGIKAEESLREQQALLSKTSFLEIERYDYQRGWFSATETRVVRFKPEFLASVQKQLPDNIRTILREPITLNSTVNHGLFADGLTPVRARVHTEFVFTPEVEKILMRFFGQQKPVTLTNTIHLSGSGRMDLAIPAFEYEELSGIKMNWQGLTSRTDYTAGFGEYDTETDNPGLTLVLADKGEAAYSGLTVKTHTRDGAHGLSLGSSELKLKTFSLHWKEGFEYDVKLNELVNLVTDLQVGAFINPTGSVPPSKIELSDLSFATEMNEEGEWVNSRGRFGFDKLHYGDTVYGPLEIDVAAEHLHAPSLLALKNKLTELSTQSLDEDALQSAIIQAARTEGLGLFTNDPIIKLQAFRFQMPEGLVDVSGRIGTQGLVEEDLQQLNRLLAKTEAEFNLSVPQKLLEEMAVQQARNIFTIDESAGGEEALADIGNTIRLMVASTIRTMQQDGYLTVDNGQIQTLLSIRDNSLSLNGKVFNAMPEDDFDPWEEEAASAGAASAAP